MRIKRREEGEGGGKGILFIICLLTLLIITGGGVVCGEDKEPAIVKKPTYVYISAGKPDPFEPFIIKEASYKSLSPEELRKLKMLPSIKTELQRVKLSSLKIVAMIKTRSGVLAMVEGPTGKGYVVKPGMGIGMKGGVVHKIEYRDMMTPLGKKIVRRIIIKEPFMDKNKKLSFRYIEINMGEKNRE